MIALRDNPPSTYPEELTVAEIRGDWWLAHTRSRHEKALAFDLRVQGISFFLPMVEKTTLIRGRRFRGLLPLFPGYLFLADANGTRDRALRTNHVAQLIAVTDQEQLVRELCEIESALEARVRLDPFPFLRGGRQCRITAGALRGFEGIVVRRHGTTRLVLQVTILGQSVSTEVDPSFVELVD